MELFEKIASEFPVQTEAVVNAERNGRLSHAYIIHSDNAGTRGDFSAFLACVAACPNSSDGRPCGVCKTCIQLLDGTYPELFTLSPISKSRQIRIGNSSDDPDTMRWFQYKFHLTSVSEGRRKVGVIYDADCANEEAQNSFLKTLEEPAATAIFLLCTEKPQSLFTTIRSRCHTISLLKNSCDYRFKGDRSIAGALFELQTQTGDGLLSGECAASVMTDVSGSLKHQAEERISPLWEDRIVKMERACEEVSAPGEQRHWNSMLKAIQERRDSAVSAEYLGLRMVFTSFIHTWFAQTYQLSCAAALDDLSDKSIYQTLDPGKLIIPEEKALRHLCLAENLLANLHWNVNEELAFREFCLAVALRQY